MLWLWRTKLFQKNIWKYGIKRITNRWAWELELSKAGGSPEKVRHSREVPWQPWEWEPARSKQPPTTASHWRTPIMSGKSCALNSQNQTPNSDPQISAEQATANMATKEVIPTEQWFTKISGEGNCEINIETKAPMQAHRETSPWGHPTGHVHFIKTTGWVEEHQITAVII